MKRKRAKLFQLLSFSAFQRLSLVSDDFGERPALEFGKRPGFDDADAVADLGLAVLVMHVVFLRAFDDFVEARMGNAGDVFDDEGFVHLVGDDHANTGFTKVDLSVRGSFAHGRNKCALVVDQARDFAVSAVMI